MSIHKQPESHYENTLEEEEKPINITPLETTETENKTLADRLFNRIDGVKPTTLEEELFKTPISIGKEIIYPEQEDYITREMLKDKEAINLAIKSLINTDPNISMSKIEKEALRNIVALADLFANKGRLEVLNLQIDRERAKKEANEIKESAYFKDLKEKARLSREARGVISNSGNEPVTQTYTRVSKLTIDEIEAVNNLSEEKKKETITVLVDFIENNRNQGLSEELIIKYKLLIEAVTILIEGKDYESYIESITPKTMPNLIVDQERRREEVEKIKNTEFYSDLQRKVKEAREKRAALNSVNN